MITGKVRGLSEKSGHLIAIASDQRGTRSWRRLEQVDDASIVARRDAEMRPEKMREMTVGRKTQIMGDIGNRLAALRQTLHRCFEAQDIGVDQRCDLRIALEQSEEMRPRQAGTGRQLFDVKVMPDILLHQGNRLADARIHGDRRSGLQQTGQIAPA